MRHEEAYLQPHLAEVAIGRREFVLLILHAQDRVSICGPVVGLAARCADANDGRLLEVFSVNTRAYEVHEKLSMQIAKAIGRAERGSAFVVLRQEHAEVVVTHIGREVVPDDAIDLLAGFLVEDACLQDFDQWNAILAAFARYIDFDGDDLELNGVALTRGIIPVSQGIEPVVDHLQCVPQVLQTMLASGQIGKVGRDARAIRGAIVLVETKTFNAKSKFLIHGDECSNRVQGIELP